MQPITEAQVDQACDMYRALLNTYADRQRRSYKKRTLPRLNRLINRAFDRWVDMYHRWRAAQH